MQISATWEEGMSRRQFLAEGLEYTKSQRQESAWPATDSTHSSLMRGLVSHTSTKYVLGMILPSWPAPRYKGNNLGSSSHSFIHIDSWGIDNVSSAGLVRRQQQSESPRDVRMVDVKWRREWRTVGRTGIGGEGIHVWVHVILPREYEWKVKGPWRTTLRVWKRRKVTDPLSSSFATCHHLPVLEVLIPFGLMSWFHLPLSAQGS